MLLAGPLLAALHEAEARHRFCNEHGVLEEVFEAADGEASRPGEDPALAAPGARLERGAEPEGGHARCAFHAGTRPRAACPAPPAVAALAPPFAVTAPSPTLDLAPAPTPIILFAPKTSPPSLDRSL
jgi:hypothetical protein